MDIETRVSNLENLVKSLVEMTNNNKFYTDADIDGCRQGIAQMTPHIETKTAYYKESEVTFYDVPDGNVTVFFDGYAGSYSVKRLDNRLVVSFDALEKKTEITISIM